ncbi:hypothetical protein GCM10022409_36390 [Hymenobacter glaciei]|uniref:Uncharacterized protein n=1 Tax=Hymenobacter glaciei TaxID=877209 RepID=A0ABP7ULZ6_9BACT
MDILSKIAWSFNKTEYKTIDDFNHKLLKYQLDIMKERACWKSDEIVVDSPVVEVEFMAWIKKGSLAENETLLEGDDFFEDEDNSEGGLFQADIKARFEADNGQHFTALELLYKLDKQMKSKELGDHIFFEGLGDEKNEDGVSVFYMGCGS